MKSFVLSKALLFIVLLQLAACSTVIKHPIDVEMFDAKPVQSRVIQAPNVTVELVSDVHAICERQVGAKAGLGQRYQGCATWYMAAKRCVVTLGHKPDLTYLGHELRHCFEGAFH